MLCLCTVWTWVTIYWPHKPVCNATRVPTCYAAVGLPSVYCFSAPSGELCIFISWDNDCEVDCCGGFWRPVIENWHFTYSCSDFLCPTDAPARRVMRSIWRPHYKFTTADYTRIRLNYTVGGLSNSPIAILFVFTIWWQAKCIEHCLVNTSCITNTGTSDHNIL